MARPERAMRWRGTLLCVMVRTLPWESGHENSKARMRVRSRVQTARARAGSTARQVRQVSTLQIDAHKRCCCTYTLQVLIVPQLLHSAWPILNIYLNRRQHHLFIITSNSQVHASCFMRGCCRGSVVISNADDAHRSGCTGCRTPFKRSCCARSCNNHRASALGRARSSAYPQRRAAGARQQ